jgi:hypothetical protein
VVAAVVLISPVSEVQFLPPPPKFTTSEARFLADFLNVPENVPTRCVVLCDVPVAVAETTSRVLRIDGTDDVIAAEHRACKMAGARHGDALRYAVTDEVTRGSAPEVV